MYIALLFTTKSTVETVRFLLRKGVNNVLRQEFNSDPIGAFFGKLRAMCWGNAALDARAVTTAFTHIVKKRRYRQKSRIFATKTLKKRWCLPEDVIGELEALREHRRKPPTSVAY
ncbi:hypothetical protein HPB50_023914 [Hyalomma asiaticum]|uniref:Uncharacterized protein n=1 Tax=Hyalomma asiaticum TaxID=266040 RepID=A0ACB7SBP5_HYAAI|nr:hypothetical protein HPB50_023914 [Hyalomma asiaticum]